MPSLQRQWPKRENRDLFKTRAFSFRKLCGMKISFLHISSYITAVCVDDRTIMCDITPTNNTSLVTSLMTPLMTSLTLFQSSPFVILAVFQESLISFSVLSKYQDRI